MGGTAGRLTAPLVELAARTIQRHAMLAGGERVLAAVSGGPDSVALLHVLLELAPRLALAVSVAHVDHGLRPDSARDAEFVSALGARHGAGVDVVRVALPAGSDEARARRARQAALAAVAARVGADRIALGHTADDQAETVLMRLLEAGGVRGLAGIPPVRGQVIRPLLDARRRDVLAALEAAGLSWLEDPTNADLRFRRNEVRHRLLPALHALTGRDVVPVLVAVAGAARAAADAVEATAERALERLATREPQALTCSRAALAALPPPVAVETLRQAAARFGGHAPLRAWGHRGLARVLAVPPPRRAFRLGGVVVEVSGDRIRVAASRVPALVTRTLDVPGRVALAERGEVIEARVVPGADYVVPRDPRVAAFDADAVCAPFVVRARRAGDRFEPFGASARRLKSFLIDAKVPRWERERLPVVEADGRIVWLAGLRRGAAAPVGAVTQRIVELRLIALA